MKKTAAPMAFKPFSIALFILSILFSVSAFAQNDRGNRIAKKTAVLKLKGVFQKETFVFAALSQTSPEISALVKKYTLLDMFNINDIKKNKPAYLNFSIPTGINGKQLKLTLYKEDISPNGFTLLTDKGIVQSTQDIVHYRGSIDDDINSVAAFTFSGNEVSGFINNSEGNYVIGKTDAVPGKHIIYNDKDLLTKVPFDCSTNTFIPLSPVTTLAKPEATATSVATKCVNWYWETDYDMFVSKKTVDSVNKYMQGVFNQMATLYANDGMTMTLKTLFVWTTEDPYTGPTTSDYLNQFGANRTTFDGDLAHLIGLKGSGGIAWIKGLCKTNKYRMAYSGISTSYKSVPSYSWTVECITHEQGHLLGSPHTHDCAWNGNNTKIDGCGDAAGYSSGTCEVPSSLPSGGGTIMSYCHLTSAGINFNLGFGPQPTELMINTINAATCLVTCNTSCTVPSQPGTITGSTAICTSGTSVTYSVAVVPGATSYTWTLPSGWTGTSTTNSITATAGTTGGTISVKANNSCGGSTARTLAVTVAAAPAQPGTISGSTSVCPGTSQTYSVTAVTGAASYTWTLPSGWTGTSTTNSITAAAGTTGGTVSIKANNSCGSSIASTATITINSSAPAQPGSITGNTTACSGTSQTYSVTAVQGAASYKWTLPSGWTGTSTTNSITATTGSAGGYISVSAVNDCGTGTAKTLAVSITTGNIPAKPGAITGSAMVCPNVIRSYYIPAVTGATSYLWAIPTGSVMIDSTPGFIRFRFGTSAGNITVKAVNGCSTSAASVKTVGVYSGCIPGLTKGTTEGITQTGMKMIAFPNPARDKINIQFNAAANTAYTLTITDMVGRTIIKQNKTAMPGLNLHSFNVAGFAKGTYIIKMQSKDDKQLLKVNVE